MSKNLSQKLLISLTGRTNKDWQNKLKEIDSLQIKTIALFLEMYDQSARNRIYKALAKSCVKKIPLIHIRNDMTKAELKYLCQKYKSFCLTIHENSFNKLPAWRGYRQHLYLEMNYNNKIPRNVNINKIGGFCIDLSHFKAAEEKWTKEFIYILKQQAKKKLFKCNHLNGYSYKKNKDVHNISSVKEFDYLKTLPPFIWGKIIALEVFNSIKEQLRYKEYIIKLLEK